MVQINEHIHEKYKTRCTVLSSRTDFATLGNSHQERKCLETLIDLVVGTFSVLLLHTNMSSFSLTGRYRSLFRIHHQL